MNYFRLHLSIYMFLLDSNKHPSTNYVSNEGRKKGHILLNDALNTFLLRLYGVRHMVKDHSDSERQNPLPPYRIHFPNSSKASFICIITQTGKQIPRPLLHQSMGDTPSRINPTTHSTMIERSYHGATSRPYVLNEVT